MGRLTAALRAHNLSPGAVALAGGLVGLSLLCLAAPGVAPFVGISPGRRVPKHGPEERGEQGGSKADALD